MLTLVKNNADAMVKNQYNENLLQIIYKRYPQLKEHIASTWPIAADQLENPEIFKQIDIKTLQSEVAKEAREEKRLKKSVKEENVGGGTIKALISQLRSSSEREIELTAWTTDRSKKVDAPPKQKEKVEEESVNPAMTDVADEYEDGFLVVPSSPPSSRKNI
jgi:hypothetical protein